jgi:hypothetical protein
MKINWAAVAVVAAMVGGIAGWCVTVENRLGSYSKAMELSERVKNIEDLMLPILVEYETRKRINGHSHDHPHVETIPIPAIPEPDEWDDVRQEASDWAVEEMHKFRK